MTELPAPYVMALRGDLRVLPAWIESTGRTDPEGWGLAAHVLWWFARPKAVSRPTIEITTRAETGHVEAIALLGRAALLELDLEAVARAVEVLARAEGTRAEIWHALLRGQLRALEGDAEEALAMSESALRRAMAIKSSTQVVEATLLRAIAQMIEGKITDATATARRASRMAQTEHIWISHLSVSVVLARLRRLSGRPHLAGLVAGACLDAAPPLWQGCLRWELLFAGVLPPASEGSSAMDGCASAATRMLTERLSEDDIEALRVSVARSAPHRFDLTAATAAMSLVDVPCDAHTRRWISGATAEAPPALAGLTPPAWGSDPAKSAPVVLATPQHPGRRILGFAAPELPRLDPVGSRPARPEALAATLVLAGPEGMTRAELFARCYGFAFRKAIHEPSFKVVRHQTRKLLGGMAQMHARGDVIHLEVLAPFALSDPRCHQPLQEVMLRHLARGGSASAKELAQRLGIPLRTVQLALQEMTEDGVCAMSKDGRKVAYVIEDTTFCEVTVV